MKTKLCLALLTVATSVYTQDNNFSLARILTAFDQSPAAPNAPYSICAVVGELDERGTNELACLDITHGLNPDTLETPEQKFLAKYVISVIKDYEGSKLLDDKFAEAMREILEAIVDQENEVKELLETLAETVVAHPSPELEETYQSVRAAFDSMQNNTQEM